MSRRLAAASIALALAAPRAALAGDIGSTIVSVAIPGMVFLFVLAIVGGAFYTDYRRTRERQVTLRLAIEKGAAIPPDLVAAASRDRDPEKDLRAGVRQVFIGIGVGVMLYFVSPFKNVWAVGVMIAIFGLGHLAAWWIGRGREGSGTPAA
jgi:Domain of unknown function (DUF6249)